MRGRGRSSGGGSSGKSAPKETQKEKPNETPKESSSSDDSEDSGPPQILKKRTDKPASREILSADVAREEVESLLNEPPPKTIAQKKTGSAAPAVSHSAGSGGSAQNWWHRESRGIQHAAQAST